LEVTGEIPPYFQYFGILFEGNDSKRLKESWPLVVGNYVLCLAMKSRFIRFQKEKRKKKRVTNT